MLHTHTTPELRVCSPTSWMLTCLPDISNLDLCCVYCSTFAGVLSGSVTALLLLNPSLGLVVIHSKWRIAKRLYSWLSTRRCGYQLEMLKCWSGIESRAVLVVIVTTLGKGYRDLVHLISMTLGFLLDHHGIQGITNKAIPLKLVSRQNAAFRY